MSESALECPICFVRLHKPKILTCGHNICEKCEEKYTSRNDNNTTTLSVKCPICQQLSELNDGFLPVNHGLAELLQRVWAKKGSEEKQLLCSVCKESESSGKMFVCSCDMSKKLCGFCTLDNHMKKNAVEDGDHQVEKISVLIEQRRAAISAWRDQSTVNNNYNKIIKSDGQFEQQHTFLLNSAYNLLNFLRHQFIPSVKKRKVERRLSYGAVKNNFDQFVSKTNSMNALLVPSADTFSSQESKLSRYIQEANRAYDDGYRSLILMSKMGNELKHISESFGNEGGNWAGKRQSQNDRFSSLVRPNSQ